MFLNLKHMIRLILSHWIDKLYGVIKCVFFLELYHNKLDKNK